MNRPIKFRAWDNKGKRFTLFPFLVRHDGIAFRQYDGGGHVEDFTLMQFTGLTDKNGREIYEGDIYRLTFDGGKTFDPDLKAVRNFVEDSYWLKSLGYQGQDVEVIGNIYENPELLKV